LATAYRKGTGVTQDYKKAVKWFTLAAEQGDASAQYNLGVMHSFGLGIIPDYKPAVKWFTLAAEQGNALAQYNLGRLYYLGQGVSENLVYAHMWSKQSSRNGFKMGDDLSKLLTDFMSIAQIEEANQLENDCLKKKYKAC
jgi:TPR repeat protein